MKSAELAIVKENNRRMIAQQGIQMAGIVLSSPLMQLLIFAMAVEAAKDHHLVDGNLAEAMKAIGITSAALGTLGKDVATILPSLLPLLKTVI